MDQMEKTIVKDSILSNYDEVFQAYASDIETMDEKITVDCEKFLQHYENKCSQMEASRKFLQQRENEIQKKEAKLQKEKTQRQLEKKLRERLSFCKQMVNESCISRKAGEGLKNELEMLRKRRAELEAQLKPESFENLHREIMQLETALQQDDCIDLQETMKNLQIELIKKDEQLQGLKKLENSYRLAILEKNDELQEARWELTDGLKTNPCFGYIPVKTMGVLDSKPFFVNRVSSKATKKNAENYQMVCKHLKDPNWHPFTVITVGSEKREIINEKEEKMVALKAECSEEQYRAVVTVLNERNEYRPNGGYLKQELWNLKEKRKASLKEGIVYIVKEWKLQNQK